MKRGTNANRHNRSALFWDFTQRRMVILYRPIGSWTALPLNIRPIGCPETPVWDYQSMLRKIPEGRRSHLRRGGSWNHALTHNTLRRGGSWNHALTHNTLPLHTLGLKRDEQNLFSDRLHCVDLWLMNLYAWCEWAYIAVDQIVTS